VDREVGWLDENVGPNPSHQILLADQLSSAFKQGDQNFQRPASDMHGLVAFLQEKLRWKQAERSERNLGWSGAGRSRSFLGERLVCVRIPNGGPRVNSPLGVELRQASGDCSRS
jgi:hypothetical protein